MAWSELTRRQHARTGGRYASDLTDEDRAVIFPLLPGPDKSGRPREVELRDVWGGNWRHRCRRGRVVSFAKGLSAGFNGSVLFPQLA